MAIPVSGLAGRTVETEASDIRASADVSSFRPAHPSIVMHIQIWLEEAEPPRGRAERFPAVPGPAAESFIGWLGLLRALYELIETKEDS